MKYHAYNTRCVYVCEYLLLFPPPYLNAFHRIFISFAYFTHVFFVSTIQSVELTDDALLFPDYLLMVYRCTKMSYVHIDVYMV